MTDALNITASQPVVATLHTVTIVRDEKGRTLEVRQPIIGDGAFAMAALGNPTYWTRVEVVQDIGFGQPMRIGAFVQLDGASPVEVFATMQAQIDEKARAPLQAEADRMVAEIMAMQKKQNLVTGGAAMPNNAKRGRG